MIASIFGRWLDDPQASATLAIAIFGGGFALYRFRFVPRERKRETLDAMQKAYAASREMRAKVLPSLPPYLAEGRKAMERAVDEAGVGRSDLQADLDRWSNLTDTAAHEILASEVKFRSLLWTIGEIRSKLNGRFEGAAGAPTIDRDEAESLASAKRLVNQLNDFAQMVELSLFPQGDVLGQFHRSIAAACKAVEPIIWHANVFGGRWGLRVLRLQLRAEQYNDAKEIHRASALVWGRGDGSAVLVRAALYRSDYGRHVPTERLARTRFAARLMLRLESAAASVRGRYGGRRLRAHIAAENDLIGCLKFAASAPRQFDPLDLTSWTMKDLHTRRRAHWEANVAARPEQSGESTAGTSRVL